MKTNVKAQKVKGVMLKDDRLIGKLPISPGDLTEDGYLSRETFERLLNVALQKNGQRLVSVSYYSNAKYMVIDDGKGLEALLCGPPFPKKGIKRVLAYVH